MTGALSIAVHARRAGDSSGGLTPGRPYRHFPIRKRLPVVLTTGSTSILFSFITMNWRAKPLVSYRVIVDLISATATVTGLEVHCELDTNTYPKGIAVSDDDMATINIVRADFHGEWNYTIKPINRSESAIDS